MERSLVVIKSGNDIKFNINEGEVTGIIYQNDPKRKTLILNNVKMLICGELVCLPDKTEFLYEDILRYEYSENKSLANGPHDTSAVTVVIAGSNIGENYVYIDSDKYENAIEEINKETFIACAASIAYDNTRMRKDGFLSLLTIATSKTCFVFDMLKLTRTEHQSFFSHLKSIFESPKILKIFHDCRPCTLIFRHQFGINLKNVYDVQVADCLIERQKNQGRIPQYARSLLVLLVNYLHLNDLSGQLNAVFRAEDDDLVWRTRPLKTLTIEAAVLQVKYLFPLQQATVSALLSDLACGVNMYLNASDCSCDKGNDFMLPEGFAKFDYHRNCSSDIKQNLKINGNKNYSKAKCKIAAVSKEQQNTHKTQKIPKCEKSSSSSVSSNTSYKSDGSRKLNDEQNGEWPHLVDVSNGENCSEKGNSASFEDLYADLNLSPSLSTDSTAAVQQMPSLVNLSDFEQFKDEETEISLSARITENLQIDPAKRPLITPLPNGGNFIRAGIKPKTYACNEFSIGLGRGRSKKVTL